MSSKKNILGCFGTADKIFAGHPLDKGRAFELLKILFKNHVTLKEVKQAVKKFLDTSGTNLPHINEQLREIC